MGIELREIEFTSKHEDVLAEYPVKIQKRHLL